MSERLKRLTGFGPAPRKLHTKRTRGPVTHVIILDGTMSSLETGRETNAGVTFNLLKEMAPSASLSIEYEAGIQWQGYRRAIDVMAGVGINRQIRRAYGYIASRYRPGDKIFLFGYSRGAYAVRSLAGVIDRIGLLRSDCATERNVRQVYRHYRKDPDSDVARAFHKAHCHETADIEMVGVWDTVRALGFRAPIIWRFSPEQHQFHDHSLGNTIRHGYHALAMHETRRAFEPVLWNCHPEYTGEIEQMWFRGTHGDVGGQLSGFEAARPLANIPLVWMLEKAEGLGLPLPEAWQSRFHMDVTAPSVGTWQGFGKLFIQRRKRRIGLDPSERIHKTALGHTSPAKFQRRLPFMSRT